jgi:aryl-alcohol dehydrogenase-like predicted oxidoreductase
LYIGSVAIAEMQRLKLGRSGIEVSDLCLGTAMFGSKHDESLSFRLLDYFAERGGSFIDTANSYASWLPGFQGGESETVIGKWMAMRGIRQSMVVATKLGFDYPDSAGGLSAGEIERECEKSLRRLQTDRIDLYYAHRDDRATAVEETMEAFHRLIAAGKIRAIGASNLRGWRIADANQVGELKGWNSYCAIQQKYTYLRPRHGANFGDQIFLGEEVKEFAQSNEISLIGYSVLLSGAYSRSPEALPVEFAWAESSDRWSALRSVASETEATVNQVILAWMRQSAPAVLPIITGSRVEQLAENIGALTLRLSDSHMEILNNAGNPKIKTGWLQSK